MWAAGRNPGKFGSGRVVQDRANSVDREQRAGFWD